MTTDLIVCTATDLEAEVLRRELGGDRGSLAGKRVELVRTGIGPVSAAHAVTLIAERTAPPALVVCGIGGAYPGAGLEVGDVACATTEVFGDLGADSPDGFLDFDALGFAVPDLACDLFPAERRMPFVTVATCTGTDARAAELRGRTGGAVESMEGAAVVQVCRHHGIPVGEVRGISNPVGRRDRAAWRIREASEAAQHAVLAWIEAGAC